MCKLSYFMVLPLLLFLPFCKGLAFPCARTRCLLISARTQRQRWRLGSSPRRCSEETCAVATLTNTVKCLSHSLNILKYMVDGNSPNVWRGRGKRQRREGAPFRVSLLASLSQTSPRISLLSAAPRPVLLRLSAAWGHRPTLPRLSGVSSPVSRVPGNRGFHTLYAAKVPPAHRGHRLAVSLAAGYTHRCGLRPVRWPVSQVEGTWSGQRWALSAPRTETAPGSGALGLWEPLHCWAHRHRVQLRNVSPPPHLI